MSTRKFDGKSYTWAGSFSTKRLAESFAKGLRSEGYSVRTTRGKHRGIGTTFAVYNLWRRRKK